jgi:hypothetical protein
MKKNLKSKISCQTPFNYIAAKYNDIDIKRMVTLLKNVLITKLITKQRIGDEDRI